ncbi:MAG: outer membrane beta-barrel protein [Bacteroidota bacterium]
MEALKAVIVSVVIIVSHGCAHAQDDIFGKDRLFDGRLIIGSNITQVDGDTYYGFNKVGLHVGAQVYVHFSKMFGAGMELLYAQKGARGGVVKESYTVGTYIDKYYLNLNYAEVPVTLHFKPNPFWDFEVGAAYARLISSKEWAESDVPVQIRPEWNSFDKSEISYLCGASRRVYKRWEGGIRLQYSARAIRPRERVPLRYTEYTGQYSHVFCIRMAYIL